MIIEFSLKNFRSFRELATLSFEADPATTDGSILIKPNDNLELLPAVGIFGPNASGKSNITKALAYMQWAMLNSDYLNKSSIQYEPFQLNDSTNNEPSFFQIVLWDIENKIEYRYGFEINSEHVVSEWLETYTPYENKKPRKIIFRRQDQSYPVIDESIKKSINHLTTNVRPNALALTVFAQFADPIASQIIKLINRSNLRIIDGGIADRTMGYAMQQYQENPELAIKVLNLMKKLDLSIQNLQVLREFFTNNQLKAIPSEFKHLFSEQTERLRAITYHKLYDSSGKNSFVEFDFMRQESLGTQRLFVLGTLLLQVLEQGSTVVLDELGASIHPFISGEIVKLFQNKATNPKGAQLIFCSHETYLMTNPIGLSKDQIYFTEKNTQEETNLHCLTEYNLKNASEIEKQYLQGRFGAVPVIWSD